MFSDMICDLISDTINLLCTACVLFFPAFILIIILAKLTS